MHGIPIRLAIEYHKKARGTLTADTAVTLPPITEPCEQDVTCDIADASGTVVSRCVVTWRLAPPGAVGSRSA